MNNTVLESVSVPISVSVPVSVSVSKLPDDCVETVSVESSKTIDGVVLNSKLPNVLKSKVSNEKKYKCPKFVREGDVFESKPRPSPKTCSCDCTNTSGVKHDFYSKKQTCYNCGTPGHIARNCKNRAYVPYYAQASKQMPRGRSSQTNTSKTHSGNNTTKLPQATTKDKKTNKPDKRPSLKVKSTMSNTDRWMASLRSSPLKNKSNWLPKTTIGIKSKTPNTKSKSPTRSNYKSSKPNYQWIPKTAKLEEIPVNKCSLSNMQDMCWEQVMKFDSNGQPSLSMDWVPTSN